MQTISCYPYILKFIDEEIHLLEDAGCISKSLSPWAMPVIIVPKNSPLHPKNQQLCLVLDYHLLNKSINAAHNGNNVISYCPLPNIIDLLARL